MESGRAAAVLRGLALGALPLALLLFTFSLKEACGPYWLGHNSDPNYVYLFNSLALCRPAPPGHIDHPGTPLQCLGAVVLRATQKIRGVADLEADVLRDPELYLNAINHTVLALWVLGLIAAGGITLFVTRSLSLALLLQASPFLSVSVLFSMPFIKPEALLATITIVFAAAVLVYLQGAKDRSPRLMMAVFGILAGVAIATKITALPLVIVPFLLLPGRRKLYFLLVTGLSFVAATLPIISQYRRFARWVFRLSTHTTDYGEGERGLIDPDWYVRHLVSYASEEKLLYGILLLSALAIGWCWLSLRRFPLKNQVDRAIPLGLAAVLLAEVFGILLAAKSPGAPTLGTAYYMVPSLGLLGLNLVLISMIGLQTAGRRSRSWCVLAFLVGLAVALVVQAKDMRLTFEGKLKARIRGQEIHNAIENQHRGCTVVYNWGASAPQFPLWMGNGYAHEIFSPQLHDLYPDALFYPGGKECVGFSGRIGLDQVLSRNACVLLQGAAFEEGQKPPGVSLEQIHPREPARKWHEVVYRVRRLPIDGLTPVAAVPDSARSSDASKAIVLD